jgi:hypothetical protein
LNPTVKLTIKQKKLFKASFFASSAQYNRKLKVANLLLNYVNNNKANNSYKFNNSSILIDKMLGLQNVPFTNNMSVVPGAHKIQKIQTIQKYNFSMYKVLASWASKRMGAGPLMPSFNFQKRIVKALSNQTCSSTSSTFSNLISELEASYNNNYLKTFSIFRGSLN